jgi:uncharacterized membrane-anchored protein
MWDMLSVKMSEKTNPRSEIIKLLAVVLVILVVVIAFVLYLSWPLMTGKTVVLSTMPVDPFDIFRGQYITLNYNISSIPITLEGASVGDDVYISLEKEEETYEFKSASLKEPEGLFIAGNIIGIYEDRMRVRYGIEQYFFERNAQFSTRNLQVEVKIDSSGRARISRLLQNGNPIEINYSDMTLTS